MRYVQEGVSFIYYYTLKKKKKKKLVPRLTHTQLQEIIDLAISAPRTPADLPLLSATIDDFHASLPLIGQAISRSLSDSALDIARVAYPEGTSPYAFPPTPHRAL